MTILNRARSLRSCLMCAASIAPTLAATTLAAPDPAPSLRPRTIDDQFNQAVEDSSRTPAEVTPEAVLRTMEQAEAHLQQQQLSEARRQQQLTLEQLDQLLSEAQSIAASRPEPQSAEQSRSESSGEDPAEGPSATSGGPATDSSATARSRQSGQVTRVQRDLSTAVWGHLPDRLQERLRQAYDGRYLPEYSDLVEQYYESLARKRLKSSEPTEPADRTGSE